MLIFCKKMLAAAKLRGSSVFYSGRLGDRYTAWGIHTLASKNHFSSFLFSVVFQQKIRWSSDQWFHNASDFLKWLRIQNCWQKRKPMRQRGRSERRKCQRKCFHSFKYLIDRLSVHFVFYVNSLHWLVWFFLYYLMQLLSSDRFAALTGVIAIQTFYLIWIYDFLKNHPWKIVFRNVS